jgi:hypothetical protein
VHPCIRELKSTRMSLAGQLSVWGEKRNAYRVSVKKLGEKTLVGIP